jgi:hypothetical protein
MPYAIQNANVFTAAFSGALAGMGVSGRVPISANPARYSGLIAVANAFAEQFDTLWGATAVGTLEVQTISESSESLWQNRAPIPSVVTLNPLTWESECQGIIAIVQEALAWYASQGYTNPAIGGGGTVAPWSFVKIVDGRYVGPTPNGSVATPYQTVQQAVDDAIAASLQGVSCFIVSSPGFTPGDVIVPVSSFALFVESSNLDGFIGNVTMADSSAFIPNNIQCGDVVMGSGGAIDAINFVAASISIAGGSGGDIQVDGRYSIIGDTDAPDSSLSVTGGGFINGATINVAGLTMAGGGDYSVTNTNLGPQTSSLSGITMGGATSFVTAGQFALSGVEFQGAVPFTNAVGVEFRMDATSLYYFERFGSTLSSGGDLVFTSEVTPSRAYFPGFAFPLALAGTQFAPPPFTVPLAKLGQQVSINMENNGATWVPIQQQVSSPDNVTVIFIAIDNAPAITVDIRIATF